MKKSNRIIITIGMAAAALGLVACGAEEQPKETAMETAIVIEADEYEFLPGDEYVLVWSDEFDGDSLDKGKWSYQLGNGGDYGNPGWGNGESQIYSSDPKNVSVSDGSLKITALKEKLTSGEMGFTSGRIRTLTDDNEALFSTTFGRVEARIMMEGGSGIWPAFWMLPVDSSIYGQWAASGEIDITEVRGRIPNVSTGTVHFGNQWPDNVYESKEYTFADGTDVSDYHVYAVEWEPEEMRWFIDDECFYTLSMDSWYANSGANATEYTKPAPFDVPFYILLNVAVGGNFDPEANLKDDSFPGVMTVDYVRVYQKSEGYEEALKSANAKSAEVEDGIKKPLNSGNCVYNGTFDQGKNHMGYWNCEEAVAYVDPYDWARGLQISADDEGVPRLYQSGLYLEADSTYGFKVDACAKDATDITVRLLDDDGQVISEERCQVDSAESKAIAYKLENNKACENATLEIIFTNGSELKVDNILLMQLSKSE